MPHKFDPDNWRRLESDERRALLPPEQILSEIGLETGHTIVDVGAGTGYFAIPAADRVGPHGIVYAVDVAAPMLDLITRRIAGKELPIELVHSQETDIPLPEGIADHVFTSTVLHEVDPKRRIAFVQELVRLLKPGGRLSILDWAPVEERTMGPPSHIRLSKDEVKGLLRGAKVAITSSEFFGSDFYIVQGTRR